MAILLDLSPEFDVGVAINTIDFVKSLSLAQNRHIVLWLRSM